MAIFTSSLINARTRCNLVEDSSNNDFTATFILPIGQQVTSGDVYQIGDVSCLHVVNNIRVYTDKLDDGTTLTSNWGFAQIAPGLGWGGLSSTGVAQDYDVASGVTYVSPATNATYYTTASTVGRAAGWSSLTLATTTDPTGPGGPIRLTFSPTVTPTQTTSSAAQRVVRVQFSLERVTPQWTANTVVHYNHY